MVLDGFLFFLHPAVLYAFLRFSVFSNVLLEAYLLGSAFFG